MRTVRHIAWCALAAVWMMSQAYGQLTTATVTGTVTDATGAAIPGAALSLENTTRGAVRTAVSDSSGRFSFDFVQVGSYRLTVTQKGFETGTRSGIDLAAGAVLDLPMQLVGAAANHQRRGFRQRSGARYNRGATGRHSQ